MRKSVRKRHSDSVKYVVCVLWLIGHSERTIAGVLSLRRKQVAGIITRSDYAGRSTMTDHERAEKLKELRDIRFDEDYPLDGGLLDRVPLTIIPLGSTIAPGPLRRRLG